MNIAIITCENYKCCEAIGVIKEQTRDLKVKDLDHVNYDPELSYKNVVLEHDNDLDRFKTYRGYIENFYEKNDLVGRFNLDTNSDRNATKVLSSFVVSGTRDFFSSFSNRDEIVDYFREAHEFLKNEYPNMYWVDCRVHFDEKGLVHAHHSGIPLYINEKGEKSLNISKQQKGKDYFRGFQDRFYNYMRDRYPDKDLQRTDPNRDHNKKMSVREYKDFKDIQREFREKKDKLIDRVEKLNDVEKKLDERVSEVSVYQEYFNKVDNYCNRNGITHYQYEKQVFYADRGIGEYPAPERFNPDRVVEREQEKEIEREHERDIER